MLKLFHRTSNQKRKEFHQKLIADYQSVAESKKAQKEAEIWDETISDMWRKDE
jgi:hypothetical protein